mmetsp:Transcript_1428/g.4312  ORF Transcript_1428/g.4312 Transcript_1428/m.4312 type:complete len:221 (+) Transcript_1428:1364-2026(+)
MRLLEDEALPLVARCEDDDEGAPQHLPPQVLAVRTPGGEQPPRNLRDALASGAGARRRDLPQGLGHQRLLRPLPLGRGRRGGQRPGRREQLLGAEVRFGGRGRAVLQTASREVELAEVAAPLFRRALRVRDPEGRLRRFGQVPSLQAVRDVEGERDRRGIVAIRRKLRCLALPRPIAQRGVRHRRGPAADAGRSRIMEALAARRVICGLLTERAKLPTSV